MPIDSWFLNECFSSDLINLLIPIRAKKTAAIRTIDEHIGKMNIFFLLSKNFIRLVPKDFLGRLFRVGTTLQNFVVRDKLELQGCLQNEKIKTLGL